jgi:hypothetical protein
MYSFAIRPVEIYDPLYLFCSSSVQASYKNTPLQAAHINLFKVKPPFHQMRQKSLESNDLMSWVS